MFSNIFCRGSSGSPAAMGYRNRPEEVAGNNGRRRVAAGSPDGVGAAIARVAAASAKMSTVRQESLVDMSVTRAEPGLADSANNGLSLKVLKVQTGWEDFNLIYIHSEAPLSTRYAQLRVEGRAGSVKNFTVRVAKRSDAQPDCLHVSSGMRTNFGLRDSGMQRVTLIPREEPPARCWDTVTLVISRVYTCSEDGIENVKEQVKKSTSGLRKSFLERVRESGCVLADNHSYLFQDGEHVFSARVRLQSSVIAEEGGGLLAEKPHVTIELSKAVSHQLSLSDAAFITANDKKLASRFDFSGERYNIGGVDKYIRQFINEIIAPRLLPAELQEKMSLSSISRGGLLFGPPGTGKTLFVKVLELLLRDNNFPVKVVVRSGPEVFNRYVGESESKVREIFAEAEKDPNTIFLILIDEVDAMLPRRGVSDSTGTADKVVTQFLTCLDGVNKKNNVIVFGTTNRLDLIDPAVMRPGRMNMKMEFSLPDEQQRLQILEIQSKELRASGMFHPDVDLDYLAEKTTGFTGAELVSLIDSAKVSALRRAQGLSEEDMYFSPQAINNLTTFQLNANDFDLALQKIKPQFGKSAFMSLEEKNYTTGGYPPETEGNLRGALKRFLRDPRASVLRMLIQGPPGSGKSTLAALVQQDFGSFCSYVSAEEVVKSRDRRIPLVRAFSERSHHKSGRNFTMVIDDFDTMINFDGYNYDRGLVSMLDAFTKQSLQGSVEGKMLVLVTATEFGQVPFLPILFSAGSVFRTRVDDSVLNTVFQEIGDMPEHVAGFAHGYGKTVINC